MSYVGIFVVAALGTGLTLYFWLRARSFGIREWELLPSREAYRERFCLFILKGYRQALAIANPPEEERIISNARDCSESAGFVPNPGFEELAGAFLRSEKEVFEHFSLLIDEWETLYRSLGAANYSELAVRRAAQSWSETCFKPGWFRPESCWSSYPAVRVGTRHIEVRNKEASRTLVSKGQLEVPESRLRSTKPQPTDSVRRVTRAVHDGAIAHIHVMGAKPEITDDELAADFCTWFENAIGARQDEFGSEARAFFTPLRLKDIVSDKATALRIGVATAIGLRLEQDPDASDHWIAEYALGMLAEEGSHFYSLLEPDLVRDVTAAYTYRCKTSGETPKQWASHVLDQLKTSRAKLLHLVEDEERSSRSRARGRLPN